MLANSPGPYPVLPELVIYHELRDFGPSLRDKIYKLEPAWL